MYVTFVSRVESFQIIFTSNIDILYLTFCTKTWTRCEFCYIDDLYCKLLASLSMNTPFHYAKWSPVTKAYYILFNLQNQTETKIAGSMIENCELSTIHI